MSGYKPGYSEAHSPSWETGHAHGTEDRARLAEDENAKIMGPTPPDPGHRAMYDRGYEAGFQGH